MFIFLVNSYAHKKSGSADTKFTVPNYKVEFIPGTNPVEITTDTVITALVIADAEPAAGTLYMVAGDTDGRFLSDGRGTKAEVAVVVVRLVEDLVSVCVPFTSHPEVYGLLTRKMH